MKFMWWTAGVLLVLMGTPCLLYFGIYLGTGEKLARDRASALYRWCVVVALGSFNIWIFGRVFGAIYDLMH